MPRLFTGLQIPEEQTDELVQLFGTLEGVDWIDPDDFHVTLAFFGDVDGSLADDIVSELDRIIAPRFHLKINGVGAFTRRGEPHSVHATIEPTPDLTALQKDHAAVLRKFHLDRDRHRFAPHITLSRLKGAVSDRVCAGWLAERSQFRCDPFFVHEFVLYSARDSVGGGPYIVEDRFRLRG